MKKLLTLFVLLALVLVAAAPFKPVLSIDGNNPPTFTVTGADPNAIYEIEAQNGKKYTEQLFFYDLTPDSEGVISRTLGGTIESGTWTWELHVYGKKGAPTNRVLDSVIIDVP